MIDRDAVIASMTPDELRALLMGNVELLYVAADLVLAPILSRDPETLADFRTAGADLTKRVKSGEWRGGSLIGAWEPADV